MYDDDGNMLSDGTGWTYEWDAENRLTKATKGTKVLEFQYDYMSRNIERKVFDGLTLTKHERFVYNSYKAVEKINVLNSTIAQSFIWYDETLMAVKDNSASKIYFCFSDANKNIGQLIEADGTIGAKYDYSPFGATTLKEGIYADANPFRFSSERFDDELELIYYNYRYYSPDLGRWLSRDPIEENGGMNLYAHTKNNPVNSVDYYGKFWHWAGLAVLVAGGGGYLYYKYKKNQKTKKTSKSCDNPSEDSSGQDNSSDNDFSVLDAAEGYDNMSDLKKLATGEGLPGAKVIDAVNGVSNLVRGDVKGVVDNLKYNPFGGDLESRGLDAFIKSMGTSGVKTLSNPSGK